MPSVITIFHWEKRLLYFILYFSLVFGADYFFFESHYLIDDWFMITVLLVGNFYALFIAFDSVEIHPEKLVLQRKFWRNIEIKRKNILGVNPVATWFGKAPTTMIISYVNDGQMKNVKLPIKDDFSPAHIKMYAELSETEPAV